MLFAVLISSVLITVGLSIFNLSLKEIIISTSERESQVGYYSAYSAFECLRYWNTSGAFPPYNIGADTWDYTSTTTYITCNNMTIPLNFTCIGPSNTPSCTSNLANYYYATGTATSTLQPNALLYVNKYVVGSGFRVFITLYGHNSGIIGKRLERVMVRQLN